MQKKRPMIGLTSNLEFVRENISYTLNFSYGEAIKKAGGVPIVLTIGSEDVIAEWTHLCDGILLTGGNDIHPKHYEGDFHSEHGMLTPKLDESDMKLVKKAKEKGIPLLGICRGSHLINVALGGTLIPDINSEVSNPENHMDKGNRSKLLSHEIKIQKDSILYDIYSKEEIDVNSFHHQAIGKLGEGLRCTAHALDGVKEAFESDDGNIMGTQFHPEELRKFDGGMHTLMTRFILKCLQKREHREDIHGYGIVKA